VYEADAGKGVISIRLVFHIKWTGQCSYSEAAFFRSYRLFYTVLSCVPHQVDRSVLLLWSYVFQIVPVVLYSVFLCSTSCGQVSAPTLKLRFSDRTGCTLQCRLVFHIKWTGQCSYSEATFFRPYRLYCTVSSCVPHQVDRSVLLLWSYVFQIVPVVLYSVVLCSTSSGQVSAPILKLRFSDRTGCTVQCRLVFHIKWTGQCSYSEATCFRSYRLFYTVQHAIFFPVISLTLNHHTRCVFGLLSGYLTTLRVRWDD
jgi:hypothetical protein